MASLPPTEKINTSKFYFEWSGHPISDLTKFHTITQTTRPSKPTIWLAGDSSLDNKYWVPSSGPGGDPLPVAVPEIYNVTLEKPTPKPDVSFWLNHLLGPRATCINTSVEESMLRQRDSDLNAHDTFIKDHIQKQDVLIVSVGANDVAMRPTLATILHMLRLAWFTSRANIDNGTAWSLPYFKHLFGTKLQSYIEKIVATTKPRAVIVCMIYFPLEAGLGQSGWADMNLRALGYSRDPGKLQAAIRKMYEIATVGMVVEGTKVLPCPLFEVLDPRVKEEYVARVEPSVEGGRKMAESFVEILEREGVL
ncbi:hypothetical protein B0J11DRAFT_561608 [Dendryphion nanum]|uniref:Uncharacterized protein n=1 Tax=Dendryphion nanum TaxID=256645 RepID=A0A9P9IC78_9PLEO|nr:hypothetical protein B0J11DRAFT_561608 [Dendryphion nanum]